MISRVTALLESNVFNKKVTRHTNTQKSIAHWKEKKKLTKETITNKDHMADQLDKNFKTAVLKSSQCLKNKGRCG